MMETTNKTSADNSIKTKENEVKIKVSQNKSFPHIFQIFLQEEIVLEKVNVTVRSLIFHKFI